LVFLNPYEKFWQLKQEWSPSAVIIPAVLNAAWNTFLSLTQTCVRTLAQASLNLLLLSLHAGIDYHV
jgi:hypothetical protein